jgi:hypothetical protein
LITYSYYAGVVTKGRREGMEIYRFAQISDSMRMATYYRQASLYPPVRNTADRAEKSGVENAKNTQEVACPLPQR